MAEFDNNTAGTWTCSCGKTNTGKFCVNCGAQRPVVPPPVAAQQTEWVCSCGNRNAGKFCVKCGAPRPAAMPGKPVGAMPSPQDARTQKAAEEAAARKAAEEAAARKAAEEAAKKKEVPAVSAGETDNNGMIKKVAIGAAVLLLLIGAYFMFGKKKETPPVAEPPKVETKAETEKKDDGTAKPEAEKPMDPAVKAEKLKKYTEEMKAANAQKKQDATANEKIVFLVENVQRKGNDLTISGHFYNGKKNRTIISVKAMELDIVLRDVDKELLNEKNIKYTKAFTGMEIKPLQDSPMLTVELPGKAPKDEFNNFAVTAHDVHWEGIGK